jgi:uncharacterized surface protein with fasciclin (FAS1) repeats
VEETRLPRSWYKKPWGIGALVLGAILLAGLAFGLIFAGDDDERDVVAAEVVFVTKDSTGASLVRGFIAEVSSTSDFPNSYVWLEPEAAPGPAPIGGSTDDSGRVVFAWAPAAEVVELDSWASTITFAGNSPAGFVAPGPVVECVLARPEQQDSIVSLSITVDPPDSSVDQVVTYAFANHEFLRGDTVTCELISLDLAMSETTTVPETTVPETTVPETTVPETTVPETTVPETTVPETTAPATTVPETTIPEPAAPATATEALQAAGDYDTFLSLAASVPTVQALLDGAGPVTVFAPNDDALAGVTTPTDPAELEQLLLSHIVDGEALDAAMVFDGVLTEITMATLGTQPVAQDPPTVGGATVVEADLLSTNGVSHGIDTLLTTTA